MATKMFSDEQILDEAFRKQIIEEINGSENRARKLESSRRWELLKDQIKPHVMQRVRAQGFKAETLAVMEARCTNVNIFKKFVSKKARSYAKGIDRKIQGNENLTKAVEAAAKAMGLTEAMKKADQYRQAFKNCYVFVYPEKTEHRLAGKNLFTLCTKVKPPHQYDAIPDAYDKEKARCVIFSDFPDSPYPVNQGSQPQASSDGGRYTTMPGDTIPLQGSAVSRNMKDETIANSPRDAGADKAVEYIWWTGKYHLTCDSNGKLIPEKSGKPGSPEGGGAVGPLNPIQRMPGAVVAADQDGSFWAQGGEDVVDGTIIVNLNITDMLSILHMQGWGQLVVIGQNLAKKDFHVGPQVALELSYGAEEAASPPTAQILQHDPHTEEHLRALEVIVALLLTTNNMSVKSVSAKLDVSTIASGLAKMVDEADVMDDISEDQQYFAGIELQLLGVADAWLEAYRPTRLLLPELLETQHFEAVQITVKFHNVEQVITEEERLKNLEARKRLGIDTMVDLILKDNPGMSKEDGEKKLLEILLERAKIKAQDPEFFGGQAPQTEQGEGDPEDPPPPAGGQQVPPQQE